MQAQGVSAAVGYQTETTFGVVPAAPALKNLFFLSESIGEKVALETSQIIRSNRNPTKAVRGNRDVSGSIKTELTPQMGTLLKGALGVSTPSGAQSPYTHTIKVGALPSFVFEKGFTDLAQYLLFFGCKIGKMSLSVRPSGFQELSFDLMGAYQAQSLKYDAQSANFTVGETATGAGGATGLIMGDVDGGTSGKLILTNVAGTYVNDEALADGGVPGAATVDGTLGDSSIDSSFTDPGHTPFDGASISVIQDGGADIAYISSVDITIDNALDGDSYVIGGGGRRRSVNDGKSKLSGTITALFESMALYKKAMQYTESSLKITYTLGTGAGTAGNESMEILIPELVFAMETPVIEGPKGILYKGPFEAYYNDGAGASAIQITLMNAEATI